MTNTPTSTPAGWYSDPANSAGERWWSGAAWTEHVRAFQPAVPVYAPPAYEVHAQPSYIPLGHFSREATIYQAPLVVHTVWIWLIAVSPIWISVIVGALTFAAPRGSITPVVSFMIDLLFIVVLGVFAIRDRRALLDAGHTRAASAWWILLFAPIAYLIARRISVKRWTGKGAAPGNVFAAIFLIPLTLAIIGGVLLAFVFPNALRP